MNAAASAVLGHVMPSKTPMVARGGLLRDQVYDLIKNDMKSTFLVPGQRVPEVLLAVRYGVSRTPVREALIKLQREGLLEAADDRGYAVLASTDKDGLDRLSVRLLLDPEVARRAAIDAEEWQIESLQKAFEMQLTAHAADNHQAFVEANDLFRKLISTMCGNPVLARCATMVDEQFKIGRSEIYRDGPSRALTLKHEGTLLDAIRSRSPDLAFATTKGFLMVLIAEAKKR
jgi:DNA-binding GntR family transcriptional regulator